MGLMDKVKAQATVLAQKTQETARDSKAKFDQAQAKRRADAMLRNLGAAVYAERTGRATPGTPAEIDKLVADISAHESEHGISLAAETTEQPPAGPTATGQPQAGPTGADQPQDGPTGTGPQPGAADAAQGFPPQGGTTQV
jgi:hypothetical protein